MQPLLIDGDTGRVKVHGAGDVRHSIKEGCPNRAPWAG